MRSEHVPMSKTARGVTAYRKQAPCQLVLQGHVGERSVAAEPRVRSLSESKEIRTMSDRLLAQGFEFWPA